MTIRIEPTTIRSENVVSRHSRYLSQNVIFYGEQKKLTFDTYLRKKYVKTGNERVMVLTPGTQYRPDLVAFDVYGTQNLWWKIMEANGIYDVYDFVAGKTIILPDNVY